jgi:hypothetical protein
LLLSHKGQITVDPTAPGFAHAIAAEFQTLGIDEIDELFGKGVAKKTLRSLLNAGYKAGASWSRMNRQNLPIFGPVVMAGLGLVFRSAAGLDALRSRTIMVIMKPARRAEPYRPRMHDPMAEMIKSDLETWIQANTADILENWPDLPPGIEDRSAEVWEPLFMIANVAGGHWPQSCWNAARELVLGMNSLPPEMPLSEKLLRDIRDIFGTQAKMGTMRIIDTLYALPAPRANWLALWPERNVAPRELRQLLKPFGIAPAEKVREDGDSVRGFLRDVFEPVWATLPPDDRPGLPVQWDDDDGDDDADDA